MSPSSFLSEDHAIDTPENVTFNFEVAGIGNRFIAALIDSAIIVIGLALLNIAVFVVLGLLAPGGVDGAVDDGMGWLEGIIIALYALVNFAIIWGYYTLFEILWNGQTPGKRMVKIRVLRANGSPAQVSEIVIRNLVRAVDFLPVAYGVGLVAMFLNRQARRLGDFAGGTLVVKEQAEIDLTSLRPSAPASPVADGTSSGSASPANDPRLRYPNIRSLTVSDYELIQDVLNRRGSEQGTAMGHRLAQVIAAKLTVEPPTKDKSESFLQDVVQAYRRIQ